MRELEVVEVDVAQDRLREVLAAVEAMALQYVRDSAFEPLDHAIGLPSHPGSVSVLDAKLGSKQVELVLSTGAAFAQTERAVGEGSSVVGQHAGDHHRGRAVDVAKEPPRVGRGLRRTDAHEDRPRRPVDGHEQVAAAVVVGHLGQVFHVNMQMARFLGLEGADQTEGRKWHEGPFNYIRVRRLARSREFECDSSPIGAEIHDA